MATSILDKVFSLYTSRFGLFHKGWGNSDILEELHQSTLHFGHPKRIQVKWRREWETKEACFRSAAFSSPFKSPFLPYPKECHIAHFEMVMPKKSDKSTPIVIHFAATGDQGYVRRRAFMALPLVKRGIGSIILENPYYGIRRPADQRSYILNKFIDIWTMCSATMEEGRALLRWLKTEGFSNRGVTGISMGGYISAIVGAMYPDPVAIVPCIAPHSAVTVFTEGAMRAACNWKILKEELKGKSEAQDFMREIFSATDVRNYPAPVKPSASIIVAAKNDAYIPSYSPALIHQHWSGSQLRWLNTGHAGAFLFYNSHFHQAVQDAFEKL